MQRNQNARRNRARRGRTMRISVDKQQNKGSRPGPGKGLQAAYSVRPWAPLTIVDEGLFLALPSQSRDIIFTANDLKLFFEATIGMTAKTGVVTLFRPISVQLECPEAITCQFYDLVAAGSVISEMSAQKHATGNQAFSLKYSWPKSANWKPISGNIKMLEASLTPNVSESATNIPILIKISFLWKSIYGESNKSSVSFTESVKAVDAVTECLKDVSLLCSEDEEE